MIWAIEVVVIFEVELGEVLGRLEVELVHVQHAVAAVEKEVVVVEEVD